MEYYNDVHRLSWEYGMDQYHYWLPPLLHPNSITYIVYITFLFQFKAIYITSIITNDVFSVKSEILLIERNLMLLIASRYLT